MEILKIAINVFLAALAGLCFYLGFPILAGGLLLGLAGLLLYPYINQNASNASTASNEPIPDKPAPALTPEFNIDIKNNFCNSYAITPQKYFKARIMLSDSKQYLRVESCEKGFSDFVTGVVQAASIWGFGIGHSSGEQDRISLFGALLSEEEAKYRTGSPPLFNAESVIAINGQNKIVTQITDRLFIGTSVCINGDRQATNKELIRQCKAESKSKFLIIEAQENGEESHIFENNEFVGTKKTETDGLVKVNNSNIQLWRSNHQENFVQSSTEPKRDESGNTAVQTRSSESLQRISCLIKQILAYESENNDCKIIFKCYEGKDRSVVLATLYALVKFRENKGSSLTNDEFESICGKIMFTVGPVCDMHAFHGWAKNLNPNNDSSIFDIINDVVVEPLFCNDCSHTIR